MTSRRDGSERRLILRGSINHDPNLKLKLHCRAGHLHHDVHGFITGINTSFLLRAGIVKGGL